MRCRRVLIVDDNPDICVNIKDILDDLGYEADTAHDGFIFICFALQR